MDSSILVRSTEKGTTRYQEATDAVVALLKKGEELFIVPQCLYEFWAVATRPKASKCLGWTPKRTAIEITNIQARFVMKPDDPGIFAAWYTLVTSHGVRGKPSHDARLVAAMLVHGLTHLLTENDTDFIRYTRITVVTPKAVLGLP